jgi:hypothetical protein
MDDYVVSRELLSLSQFLSWSMHVNQLARQEMLTSLGVPTGSIARAGRALAVSKLTVKYMAPLKVNACTQACM